MHTTPRHDAPLRWRKSSHSGDADTGCVEVADLTSGVAVRDSKDPHGPRLVFTGVEWAELLDRVKVDG